MENNVKLDTSNQIRAEPTYWYKSFPGCRLGISLSFNNAHSQRPDFGKC